MLLWNCTPFFKHKYMTFVLLKKKKKKMNMNEGGTRVSLWVCQEPESVILKQMICKIQFLAETLKAYFSSISVYCYLSYSRQPCFHALFQTDSYILKHQIIPHSCQGCKLSWKFLWKNIVAIVCRRIATDSEVKFEIEYC